jgi:putative ABC transport system substrate-binding protein
MRRREFMTLLGCAAATWPHAARSQQSTANMPIVTFISGRRADASATLAAEFRKGLSQTGVTEDKDVVIEYHWLDGHYEDIPAILNEAIRRHVAVIATPGNTPGTLAAKAATSTIPIVFGVGADPVKLGLVANLASKMRLLALVWTCCFSKQAHLLKSMPRFPQSLMHGQTPSSLRQTPFSRAEARN